MISIYFQFLNTVVLCCVSVVILYTVVLLAMAMAAWRKNDDSSRSSTAGNPCLYNPSQQLAYGCENVDKCKKGLASPFQCCAAVAHCFGENVYVYPPNNKFYLKCKCGQLSGAACPKEHIYHIDLAKCVPKPEGILSAVLSAGK